MQPFKYNPNFNSGQYRHRITFQSFVEIEDKLGQRTDDWQAFKTVWAMIKTLQGREYFSAASTQNENTTRFVIRYTTGIKPNMRIIYKESIYDIQSVINDDEANKTLTIIAEEKVP